MKSDDQIVAESLARFKEFIGTMALMFAESQGWLKEYEKEIRRVIVEARKG